VPKLLKLGQNKKGSKKFPAAPFFAYFLQLAAEKKYSKDGAAGNFFSPSYSVTALTLKSTNNLMSYFGLIK
jgi:hypothetical protein